MLGRDNQKPMFLYSTSSAYALVSMPTVGLDISRTEVSRKLEHQRYSPTKQYPNITNDEQLYTGDYLSSAHKDDEQDQNSHDSFMDGLEVTSNSITGRAVHSPLTQKEDSLLAGLAYTPEDDGSSATMTGHSGDVVMEVDDTFNYVKQRQTQTQTQNGTRNQKPGSKQPNNGSSRAAKRERWR